MRISSLLIASSLVLGLTAAASAGPKGMGPGIGHGFGPPTTGAISPGASRYAPGHLKRRGTSARMFAPGQRKKPGTSARTYAPGQRFR